MTTKPSESDRKFSDRLIDLKELAHTKRVTARFGKVGWDESELWARCEEALEIAWRCALHAESKKREAEVNAR